MYPQFSAGNLLGECTFLLKNVKFVNIIKYVKIRVFFPNVWYV